MNCAVGDDAEPTQNAASIRLNKAIQKLDINLVALVAWCSVWSVKSAVRQIRTSGNNDATVFPNTRRARRSHGEQRRTDSEAGEHLDDNTFAIQTWR